MILKTIFYKTFFNLNSIFRLEKKLSTKTIDTKHYSFDEYDFIEMDEELIDSVLAKMTVKQLKKLCKNNNLRKYSRLNKGILISLLKTHFLTLRASLLGESVKKIVSSSVLMVLNEREHINVSAWFRVADLRLSRWLESKAFKEILYEHCKSENLTENDVMSMDENGDIYLDLLLALATAAQFNSRLRYDILKFYKSRLDKLKEKDATIASLTHQMELLEQGISAEVIQRWEIFDFSFAYYILVIDNVVKCGAVGLNNSDSCDNLDLRLRSHRNTHARFRLVNVFQFQDSKSVSLFESWIKAILVKHSIGQNGCLEQYECCNQDTAKVLNETITHEFKLLKKSNPKIGSICPKEKIEKYNQSVQTKTNK